MYQNVVDISDNNTLVYFDVITSLFTKIALNLSINY